MKKGRAQCLVLRNGKILTAVHCENGRTYHVVPGGGIEENETPEEAAIRELYEEANVTGIIVKKLGEYIDPFNEHKRFYNFLVDIGEQAPTLGYDPEFRDAPILIGIEWKSFRELSEKDRLYFFAGGLVCIPEILKELDQWSNDAT